MIEHTTGVENKVVQKASIVRESKGQGNEVDSAGKKVCGACRDYSS